MLWNSISLMMVFRFTEEMDCGCHIRLNTNTAKYKTIDADRLQLCAEAMCLEEMLACDIPEGALFYRQTKRRERVKLDEDLRNMVEADFLQMHDLFSRGWTPKVKQTRSCSSCSLRDLCLPELRKVKSAKAYIEERLKESGE